MQFGRGGNRVAAEEGLRVDFRKARGVLVEKDAGWKNVYIASTWWVLLSVCSSMLAVLTCSIGYMRINV